MPPNHQQVVRGTKEPKNQQQYSTPSNRKRLAAQLKSAGDTLWRLENRTRRSSSFSVSTGKSKSVARRAIVAALDAQGLLPPLAEHSNGGGLGRLPPGVSAPRPEEEKQGSDEEAEHSNVGGGSASVVGASAPLQEILDLTVSTPRPASAKPPPRAPNTLNRESLFRRPGSFSALSSPSASPPPPSLPPPLPPLGSLGECS